VFSLCKRQIQRFGEKIDLEKGKGKMILLHYLLYEGIVLAKWMFLSSCRELCSFSSPGITSDKNTSKRFFFLRVFSEVMPFPLLFSLVLLFVKEG